jgi:hypothetical protein
VWIPFGLLIGLDKARSVPRIPYLDAMALGNSHRMVTGKRDFLHPEEHEGHEEAGRLSGSI